MINSFDETQDNVIIDRTQFLAALVSLVRRGKVDRDLAMKQIAKFCRSDEEYKGYVKMIDGDLLDEL